MQPHQKIKTVPLIQSVNGLVWCLRFMLIIFYVIGAISVGKHIKRIKQQHRFPESVSMSLGNPETSLSSFNQTISSLDENSSQRSVDYPGTHFKFFNATTKILSPSLYRSGVGKVRGEYLYSNLGR